MIMIPSLHFSALKDIVVFAQNEPLCPVCFLISFRHQCETQNSTRFMSMTKVPSSTTSPFFHTSLSLSPSFVSYWDSNNQTSELLLPRNWFISMFPGIPPPTESRFPSILLIALTTRKVFTNGGSMYQCGTLHMVLMYLWTRPELSPPQPVVRREVPMKDIGLWLPLNHFTLWTFQGPIPNRSFPQYDEMQQQSTNLDNPSEDGCHWSRTTWWWCEIGLY